MSGAAARTGILRKSRNVTLIKKGMGLSGKKNQTNM